MKLDSTSVEITASRVAEIIRPHAPVYGVRAPVYQTVILQDFARVWRGHHAAAIDLGGGTGLMAEAVQSLLPVDDVTSIDIFDRFYPTLKVKTATYDGRTIPFADGSFDAATVINVIHHVPTAERSRVLSELCRVVRGPIYIKDHLASSRLDHWRLAVLDAIGNIPFGGMVSANYLSLPDWHELAAQCGCRIGAVVCGRYRGGIQAALFPNRLEVVFRLDRA